MKKLLGLCCVMLLFFVVDVSAGLIDFTHFNYSGYSFDGDRHWGDFDGDKLWGDFDGDRLWGDFDGDKLCGGFDGDKLWGAFGGIIHWGGFDRDGLCCDFDKFRHRCDCRNPIPEPATMLLLGFGLVGLAGFRRKKFKK